MCSISDFCLPITFSKFICETKEMLKVGWMLSAFLVLDCTLSTNSVTFLGRHGEMEMAAVSIAKIIITTFCLLPGLGLFTVCSTYISAVLLWSLVLSRFLQCRGQVWITMIMLVFTVLLNFLLNYIFVIVLDGGLRTASTVLVVSQYIYFIMLVVYAYWYDELTGFTQESLDDWYEFSVIGLSGFLLFALEQLNLAFVFFLCGLVGAIEINVFAAFEIILNYIFMITCGFSTAMSMKIGEKLGANEHTEAKTLAYVTYIFTSIYTSGVAFLILIVHKYIGYIFTNDRDVILELSNTMFLIAIFEFTDIIIIMLDGILQACGRQCVSSCFTFVTNHLIGLPVAIYVAFVLDKKMAGVWVCVILSSVTLCIATMLYMLTINWEKEATLAQERLGVAVAGPIEGANRSNDEKSDENHNPDNNLNIAEQPLETSSLIESNSFRLDRKTILIRLINFVVPISICLAGVAVYFQRNTE